MKTISLTIAIGSAVLTLFGCSTKDSSSGSSWISEQPNFDRTNALAALGLDKPGAVTIACANGQLDKIKEFVRLGRDPSRDSIQDGAYTITPLMAAIAFNQKEVVTYLLGSNFDQNRNEMYRDYTSDMLTDLCGELSEECEK